MSSALVIAFQAAVMFILLAFGWLLYKKKLLGDEATRQLSNIAITIINPIVIFNAYQTDFAPQLFRGLMYALLLAFIAQTILVCSAYIMVRAGHGSFEVERFALGYSNCAFMGIPLVEATFGSEGVFYLTAFITAFNVFMWTHGVVLMGGSGEKKTAADRAKAVLKILLSPAILSIVLGLIFFFTGLRMPSVIQQPLNYLGAMNTPLAMLVSGATIAKSGLLDGLKNKRIYFLQMFKLLIVPMLLTALYVPMELFGVSPIVIKTTLLAAAAPTASSTIMFAYKFGKDEGYASNHFAMSTLAGIVTMPLVLAFAQMLERLFIP
ncbi:MAG: AEC family transporter [Lachnospiraceae bacterium]|nr:AEC family transporter [Ruminococcus sp.]MCM1274890.1 AEC family transporter [Lachnospiraceae bacterium]